MKIKKYRFTSQRQLLICQYHGGMPSGHISRELHFSKHVPRITKCVKQFIFLQPTFHWALFHNFILDCLENVSMSLPIISIHDIKKFPKQFLVKEKLRMLRDGIEVTCNNLTSVKVSTSYSLPSHTIVSHSTPSKYSSLSYLLLFYLSISILYLLLCSFLHSVLHRWSWKWRCGGVIIIPRRSTESSGDYIWISF